MDKASRRKFHDISEAFDVLGSTSKRAEYDKDALRHENFNRLRLVNGVGPVCVASIMVKPYL